VLNAKLVIFQIYHEINLLFHEMMMMFALN